MGTGPRRRVAATLLWVSLVALAAAVTLQKLRAFDYWWHLRTGQLIVETGSVPKTDPFTYTVPGARWVDIHWLFQAGLYAIQSTTGHAGVVVAKMLTALALLAILAPLGYRRERPLVSVAALAGMLLLVADRLMPRPELPTFLCLAAVLALLDRFARTGDRWLYAVVPVQLLWVNVHGLFALGLALLGIHIAAELARPLVLPGARPRGDRLRRLAGVTALATLASFANPNFVDGALYPLQQLGMIGPPEERGVFGSLIAELVPTFTSDRQMGSLYLGLFAALAAASFAAMGLNWRRIHAADPLVWVAFLYLALGARRNTALFAIAAVPVLVRNLNEFLDARRRPLRIPALANALAAVVLFGLAADAARGSLLWRLGAAREPGLGVLEAFYPVGAAEWIARRRPPGPICHHMADGGYLIWRLWPDYQVMVDGRLEVFGPENFLGLQFVNPASFRALDAQHHFGTVVVHFGLVPSATLLHWLHLNSNWHLAFLDDITAVYVRTPERERMPRYVDVDAPDLFPPLEEGRSVSQQIRGMARSQFFWALQRWDRALAAWEDVLARFPDLPQGPVIHATLLAKNGLGAAAEAILRAELRERPRDASLRTQIADLRLETGDREAARALYDEALALDPSFSYALYRRATMAERDGDLDGALQLYLRLSAQGVRAGGLARLAAGRAHALTKELSSF